MALDGIVISNIVSELKRTIQNGRIDKIYQPESDEIDIMIRANGKNHKLLMTANASHPRLHLTNVSKDNPQTAPMFCMVMRKHLTGGKILKIQQPNFERIVIIHIESSTEMGDITEKRLIIEIMGKHSNIILTDENDIILDSVKHVSHEKSQVREVLPGRNYVFPPNQNKLNPKTSQSEADFTTILKSKDGFEAIKGIYDSFTGISPVVAGEICFRAKVEPSTRIVELDDDALHRMFSQFSLLMKNVSDEIFFCEVVISAESKKIIDFSSIALKQYAKQEQKAFDSVFEMLEFFYSKKDQSYRILQKTSDLRKLVQLNIERCVKKKEIQKKTLDDIRDMDKWRLAGELITANIYQIKKGETNILLQNFYNEMEDVKINLDPTLTASENAQRYFNKYNKAKRTKIALKEQIEQNEEELTYLEGVLSSLDSSVDESDILEIREELFEQGFIKKRKIQKGQKLKKSKPMHYVSSDGFDIYVGKNNRQNDELTLQFAQGNDMWFHTSKIPGSHVIVKSNGLPIPDKTLTEAAHLAAFYSKAKTSTNVPVDYTIKKNVKKPNGAKPGMVIYDNYKTAYITPGESVVNAISKFTNK